MRCERLPTLSFKLWLKLEPACSDLRLQRSDTTLGGGLAFSAEPCRFYPSSYSDRLSWPSI